MAVEEESKTDVYFQQNDTAEQQQIPMAREPHGLEPGQGNSWGPMRRGLGLARPKTTACLRATPMGLVGPKATGYRLESAQQSDANGWPDFHVIERSKSVPFHSLDTQGGFA